MGITVINPPGSVNGTSEDDTFVVTDPGADSRVLDGREGNDRLVIERSFERGSVFDIKDTFNSGEFYGIAESRMPFRPRINYFRMEDVTFLGSPGDDDFKLKIGTASTSLKVDFDGGEGSDFLLFDFSTTSTAISFTAETNTIASSFGVFSNFERYEIHGGSGDDVVRTSDGNDYILGGGGTNILDGGGGNDEFYSTSLTDFADGGSGSDYWQAGYIGFTEGLSVDIGEVVKVQNRTVAVNVEAIQIGTGLGDDLINLSVTAARVISGGAGIDTLSSNLLGEQVEQFRVTATTFELFGLANDTSFSQIERVAFTGGAQNDHFEVAGLFAPD